MSYPIPANESERIEALHRLNILDTLSEQEFDDLTRLAALICDVPVALISLVDSDRQWFKSKIGLNLTETPRETAFCAHAIAQNGLFTVEDASDDKRFADNPLVTGNHQIRFYAGAPIATEEGHTLGTLCVIDSKPRKLNASQAEALQALARQATALLKSRLQADSLEKANQLLEMSRENYRVVAESASDVIITIDENSTIVFANSAVQEIFGYASAELIGKSLSIIIPERFRDAHHAGMKRYMESGQRKIPWSGVMLPGLHRSGREIQMELSFGEHQYNGHRRFTSVIRDITEREEIKTQLQISEKYYRFLAESIPQQIWSARPDGFINYGNQRTVEYFGTEVKEGLSGIEWQKIIHPDDLSQTIEHWSRAVKTGEPYETEYRLLRSDGQYRWHLAQAKPMRDDKGAITKWFGSNTDIHDRKIAEEIARKSEAYRNLFKHANDAILIFDPASEIILDASNKAFEIYGRKREEFVGHSLKEMSQNVSRGTQELEKLLHDGVYEEFESIHLRGDGTPLHLLINAAVIDYQGQKAILTINRDVTARKKTEDALREREEHFRLLVEGVKDYAIFMLSPQGHIVSWNAGAERLKGYTAEEAIGRHFSCFYTDEDRTVGHPEEELVIAEREGRYQEEGWRVHKNGSKFLASVLITALRNESGQLHGFSKITHDITERKRAEEQLLHNALHDALTGLPNRTLFLEHLRRAIERNLKRQEKPFAVLFLDFDHFKLINDSLGHMEGDNLLRLIARRLTNCLRPGDTVARIGGDEFTILLEDLSPSGEVLQIVERLQNSLKETFDLRGNEVSTSASIGIVSSNTNYTDPETMLRDADIAMYCAKAGGKARYEIFNQKMHEQASSRLKLEIELRQAVEREEFCVYYQPIISLRTDRIKGFEALVRWHHPARGIVSPLEFISVAEETGLIIPLGLWILRQSCRQLRSWQNEDASLSISVNLSCKQFKQPDLVERIIEIIRDTKIEPGSLRLEITESHLMEDSETAISILNRLRMHNIKLSMDDFGTGYSSLSYLHRLPIDYLKIDRSFVSQMQINSENREIVRTIILLAKNLNLEVIAEGIETVEQADYLKTLNCDFGQGYLYSKPIDVQQAGTLITCNSNVKEKTAENTALNIETMQ